MNAEELFMQMIDENFKDHKQNALKKLKSALENRQVDSLIIDLLHKINSQEEYFTTSSCAGRIVVLQLPKIGDKKHAVFLGRWHRQVTRDEVFSALNSFDEGQIWLLTQPPIFHIGCKDLEAANRLMKTGISTGFKHSGIRSLSGQIIVELQSTERMDMPMGQKGKRIVADDIIPFLVETANTAIRRAQEKLNRLEEAIEKGVHKN